ncbi:MAG TPA: hypothetical protein VLT36_07910, partial [Candidatus Dormibacteraeota bacterium]|nr:hypothetical protein [Candidatus Dormibacteraeota bacterium]
RTIGQISSLICDHLGGGAARSSSAKPAAPVENTPSTEVDLESLSDKDIDLLLGGVPDPKPDVATSAGRN